MKTAKRHEIEGTYRPDRHAKKRPKGNKLTKIPREPRNLSADGTKFFKKICQDLIKLHILFESDLVAVERLAHLYSVQDGLQSIMKDLTPGAKGYRGYLQDYDRVAKMILPLESALGLNEQSRRKIDIEPENESKSKLLR